MITRENYEERINQFGVESLNPTLKKAHNWYERFKDLYDESEDVKQTADLYFEKLDRYLNNHLKETKKPTSEPKQSPEEITRPKEIANQSRPPIRSRTSSKTAKKAVPGKLVENIKEEVKIIRRYVGLHEKTKDASAILNLIKALQKAVVEKKISKKSKYAEEIRTIQKNLVKVYNGMGKEIRIEINDKDLMKLVKIAGGEKVYPSISYLKRFIGMQGKPIDKEKAMSFVESIEKSIKAGKFSSDDPYLPKVKAIQKNLKNYASGKGAYVGISEAELNGLAGIVKACGCQVGQIYARRPKKGKVRLCKKKTFTNAKRNGLSSGNNGLSGVMTASEVANQTFELLPFSGSYYELIGKPEKNFTMMIHGEPGSGKSTFLMKFAKYLSGLGKVLYLTSEEFGSVTLTSKVNEYLNPLPPNIEFASDISSLRNSGKDFSDYDFVILDSITDLGVTLEDFKKLKKENSDTAFILVLQHTKDGNFRGGKEWEHEVQIAGVVADGVINIYKNRYGVKGTMSFFN